jgi:hypothetical protein
MADRVSEKTRDYPMMLLRRRWCCFWRMKLRWSPVQMIMMQAETVQEVVLSRRKKKGMRERRNVRVHADAWLGPPLCRPD